MDFSDWVTVFALFLGPVSAVLITRWLDNRRERQTRRQEVFKTLMRTRRTPIFPEHVGALNLIEFEFANDKEVVDRWRDLFQHFGTQHVRREDEKTERLTDQSEIANRNARFESRLAQERQSLLAKLLHAMARALGFKIEQLEIFEGGYTPQGWADIELEQKIIRRYVTDLYLGNRFVPVAVLDYRQEQSAVPAETDESSSTR